MKPIVLLFALIGCAFSQTPQPQPSSFNTYEDYIQAVVDWKLDQRLNNNSCSTDLQRQIATLKAENDALRTQNSILLQQARAGGDFVPNDASAPMSYRVAAPPVPSVKPYQLPLPQKSGFNCTTTNAGSTSYTNCN